MLLSNKKEQTTDMYNNIHEFQNIIAELKNPDPEKHVCVCVCTYIHTHIYIYLYKVLEQVKEWQKADRSEVIWENFLETITTVDGGIGEVQTKKKGRDEKNVFTQWTEGRL